MNLPTTPSAVLGRWHHSATHGTTPAANASALPLKGLSKSAAAHLGQSTLLLCGLGAVGGRMLEQFMPLGLRRVIACDPDTYDVDSAITQPCQWEDAGRPKAEVQFERAKRANPTVELDFRQCDLQDLPLSLVRGTHVIAAAPDNAGAMVDAGRLAAALGRPLVQAAVEPASWSAIIRGYGLQNAEAACPACALGTGEWSRLTARMGCDLQTARRQGGPSTRSMPLLTEAAAALGTAEAVKWLSDQSELALNGEEFLISLLTHRGMRTRLPRNPACKCPHERWGQREERRHPSQVTLEMLAQDLAASPGNGSWQVRGEPSWISWAGCSECGRRVAVQRFASLGTPLGHCECGSELLAGPAGWRSVLPAADLHDCWDAPLAELGVEPGQAIGLARDGAWTYVFFEDYTQDQTDD